MITRISLTNFKGHNRAFNLGRATMIVGDNFRGKSGLFQGIALGLHGFLKHPTADKQLPPIGFASGNPMSVRLDLEQNGAEATITRSWTRSKSGSVSYDGYSDESTIVPPILLDARTYFNLSDDKRMRFVFGAVKLSDKDFSVDKLVADLKNLQTDPHTAAHEAALRDVVQTVSESFVPKVSVQDWLATLIDLLKDKVKLAKQSADRMAQTVSGITELQIRSTEDIDADCAQHERAIALLRKDIAAWQSEIGQLNAKLRRSEHDGQQFQSLSTELKSLPAVTDLLDSLDRIEKEVVAKTEELAAANRTFTRSESEVTALEQKQKDQQRLEADIMSLNNDIQNVPDHTERITNLEAEYQALLDRDSIVNAAMLDEDRQVRTRREEWAALNEKKKLAESALREAQSKLVSVDTLDACPFCHNTGDNFKAVAKEHYGKIVADQNVAIANFQTELDAISVAAQQLNTAIAAKKADLKQIFDEGRVNASRREESRALQSKRDSFITKRDALDSQHVDVAVPIAEAKLALVNAKNNKEFAELNHREVNARLDMARKMKRAKEVGDMMAALQPSDTTELRKQLADLQNKISKSETEIADLDRKVKESFKLKTDALRQSQALEERDKAQAELVMTKLAVECVSSFQQSMVDTAFGTIIADANKFCDGILPSPLVYRDGAIGRMRDGTFCGHDYLSGTEQAIAFAGISVALAMQAQFRIVQIDEMTRLSEDNKQKVLIRMCELLRDGVIHQFVGVDTSRKYYDTEEFFLSTTSIPITFIEL